MDIPITSKMVQTEKNLEKNIAYLGWEIIWSLTIVCLFNYLKTKAGWSVIVLHAFFFYLSIFPLSSDLGVISQKAVGKALIADVSISIFVVETEGLV